MDLLESRQPNLRDVERRIGGVGVGRTLPLHRRLGSVRQHSQHGHEHENERQTHVGLEGSERGEESWRLEWCDEERIGSGGCGVSLAHARGSIQARGKQGRVSREADERTNGRLYSGSKDLPWERDLETFIRSPAAEDGCALPRQVSRCIPPPCRSRAELSSASGQRRRVLASRLRRRPPGIGSTRGPGLNQLRRTASGMREEAAVDGFGPIVHADYQSARNGGGRRVAA